MKKTMLLVSIAMVALLFACGGGGEETTSAPAATAAPAVTVDPATAGTISGTITLDGTPPEMTVIQMNADPNCARLHSSDVLNEFVIVGEGQTLANAFVHIKSGIQGDFPPPSEAVTLDQKGCLYTPHVIGIQVGQTLTVRNSDETLHNIHAMPKNNKEFNIGQPVQGLETSKVFDNAEVMIPFKCDVHKWMNSYAGVIEHPYFAVTGMDGSFSMPNVPPGDYVVEVWHERAGTQEMNVTVGEKATADASFALTVTD